MGVSPIGSFPFIWGSFSISMILGERVGTGVEMQINSEDFKCWICLQISEVRL